MKKLPLIPQDKANHFVYGFIIFFILNLVLSPYFALIGAIVAAVAKEVYDQIKYGGFDYKDAIVTVVPGVMLTLKYLFLS
jgi:hypothetical protein